MLKISALSVLATTVGVSLYIWLFLSGDIKARALGFISHALRTEISLSEPELDLLTEFPYASLHLSDVHCRGAAVSLQPNALFTARRVSLLFSVWDFIFGRINLRKISLEDGTFTLLRNETGKNNWDVFNTNNLSATEANRVIFSVQRIDIRRFRLILADNYLQNHADIYLKHLDLAGNLQDEAPEIVIEATLYLDSMKLGNGLRPHKAEYHLLASLHAKPLEKAYELKTCNITSGDNVSLSLQGLAKSRSNEGFWLRAGGSLNLLNQSKLEDYVQALPLSWPGHLSLSGDLSITFHAEGLAGPGASPMVQLDFQFKNGRIQFPQDQNKTLLYCVAGGKTVWQENQVRLSVPLLALSSPVGTRLRGSIGNRDNDGKSVVLQLKGSLAAYDLWYLILEKASEKVQGILNADVMMRFTKPNNPQISGSAHVNNVILPLWKGTDSLEILKATCLFKGHYATVDIEEGRFLGEEMRGSLILPLTEKSQYGDLPPAVGESSQVDLVKLNLNRIPLNFWFSPFLGTLTPYMSIRNVFFPLRLQADQLVYNDLEAGDVEALLCPGAQQTWHLQAGGTLCGGKCVLRGMLSPQGQEALDLSLKGHLTSQRPECLFQSIRSLFPSLTLPEVLAEEADLQFICYQFLSSKTRSAQNWHTVFNAQTGHISGSLWLNQIAGASGMSEWKKTGFQQFHYEAWGDSLHNYEARGELRNKTSVLRLAKTSSFTILEADVPEQTASRIRNGMAASGHSHDLREESGKIYLRLNPEGASDFPSSHSFRDAWSQRPEVPISESVDNQQPVTRDCPVAVPSRPKEKSGLRSKRRR